MQISSLGCGERGLDIDTGLDERADQFDEGLLRGEEAVFAVPQRVVGIERHDVVAGQRCRAIGSDETEQHFVDHRAVSTHVGIAKQTFTLEPGAFEQPLACHIGDANIRNDLVHALEGKQRVDDSGYCLGGEALTLTLGGEGDTQFDGMLSTRHGGNHEIADEHPVGST